MSAQNNDDEDTLREQHRKDRELLMRISEERKEHMEKKSEEYDATRNESVE